MVVLSPHLIVHRLFLDNFVFNICFRNVEAVRLALQKPSISIADSIDFRYINLTLLDWISLYH